MTMLPILSRTVPFVASFPDVPTNFLGTKKCSVFVEQKAQNLLASAAVAPRLQLVTGCYDYKKTPWKYMLI